MVNRQRQFSVFVFMVSFVFCLSFSACNEPEALVMDMGGREESDPLLNKGIGPFRDVQLRGVDSALADKGKAIFNTKCLACHKFNERVVGPALSGVTKRRSPEWIMNLVFNTNEMVEKDPLVKGMIAEYMTKMTFQDVSKKDTRAILEYFRHKDGAQ